MLIGWELKVQEGNCSQVWMINEKRVQLVPLSLKKWCDYGVDVDNGLCCVCACLVCTFTWILHIGLLDDKQYSKLGVVDKCVSQIITIWYISLRNAIFIWK